MWCAINFLLRTARSSGSGKIATTCCVITQVSAVLSYFAVAPSIYAIFLQNVTSIRRLHSWCVRPTGALQIIFYSLNLPHGVNSAPIYQNLRRHALLILLLVPKSLLHGIPITATAQDHHSQYLQPHKTP